MTQFITSFCVGSVLIGSLYIICPKGNISKQIKYIFSLVFLIIIISAANVPLKSIDFDALSPADVEIDTESLETSAAEYVFSYTLKKQNITFKKISIFTDKTSDGSIVITKAVVITDEPPQKVINALAGLLDNREVEIINE
ncbi:MAG: hypothetical protein IJD45_01940 [Clostridia bacterium]|nr:hypothetical protein [Clostridia bacterium]